MEIHTIEELNPRGKRVLVRVDYNVPIVQGIVGDDTRIRESLETIRYLINGGGRVIIMAHLGRPAGTGFEPEFSLRPVALRLAELLEHPVVFANDIIGHDAQTKSAALHDGDVMLIENLRFDKREKKNDPEFCQALAALGDVYVNDAFGAAHRAHASLEGIAHLMPSYAGYLLQREVATFTAMLEKPERPFVAILGGSKVSDKIKVIENLIDRCDCLIIGGGMCFTFLAALGHNVGTSVMEEDWIEPAQAMLDKAKAKGVKIMLPVDVVCADAFAEDAQTKAVLVEDIPDDMMGLDIGPATRYLYGYEIAKGRTVFWNGPAGVFEWEPFAHGTKAIAESVAANKDAYTVIGGGDSVAAINKFGLASQVDFVSTGGGASMELVRGEALPGVEALRW